MLDGRRTRVDGQKKWTRIKLGKPDANMLFSPSNISVTHLPSH